MPYAVAQDVIDQFGEREVLALTDRANVGVVDADLLGRALADAGAEIDSYLVGRYTLPLAGSFPLLKRYACDITRYLLSGSEVTEVETVRNRYKDAVRFLEAVRDGKIRLGADSVGQAAPEPQRIAVVGGDRVFGADSLRDFLS
jgi:phage gp36-like protein